MKPLSATFALLVLLTSTASLQAQCTVRSGADPVTFALNNGSALLTAADFAAAASGPAANAVAPFPGWISSLPCDGAASWIATSPNPTFGASALYSVTFPCQVSPCFSQAFLSVCYAVDNNLGTAANEGLALNGIPIPGTKLLGNLASNFNTQHVFANLNVSSLVVAGLNTLTLLVSNASSASGLIFSATLTIVPPTGLCEPMDSQFVVAPMSNSQGGGPLYRNDDGFAGPIPLQFTFCHFGVNYTEVYINNNGNISFGGPFTAFNRTAFPLVSVPFIAPFWADVDTRDPGSGVVHYKSSPTRFTVTWDRVGYFNSHSDKRNTFQVIISNGADTITGNGRNVCFCYDDMQWTTGDASLGSGGFLGNAANVGINAGDGIAAQSLGRFDHAGTGYDGYAGSNDGVDYLDCKRFCFNTCSYGQQGQVGLNDLTINGAYSNSNSGLTVIVPLPGVVDFSISTVPFAAVTLLVSFDCLCPGIYTPFGEFHLNPNNMFALVDGCGVLGGQGGPAFADAGGNYTLSFALPAGLPPFCVCVQGLICSSTFQFGIMMTQSYRVCFQ